MNTSKKILALIFVLGIAIGGCNVFSKGSSEVEDQPEQSVDETKKHKDNDKRLADEVEEADNQDEICGDEYQKIIDTYGEDFSGCYGTIEESECEKEKAELESKTTNVVLIMDASGSMAAEIGGESKMEIAKNSATNFVDNMGADINLSLVVYGHEGSNSYADQSISCAGIEEVSPLGLVDAETTKAQIDQLNATGWTPIGGALEEAGKILANYPSSEYRNIVILISDGEETCGGDPESKATELFDSEIGMVTNVIGFDVGDVAEKQLEQTAENGGGAYYSAYNSEELNSALAMMMQMSCVAEEGSQFVSNNLSVAQAFSDCSNLLLGEWQAIVGNGAISTETTSPECYDYSYEKYMERYNNIFSQLEEIYSQQTDEIKRQRPRE